MPSRTLRVRQRGQVLIILFFGALLFGASAAGVGTAYDKATVKSMRTELKSVVPDSDRRQQLEALLDAWQKEGKQLLDGHHRHAKALLVVLERHDAKPADVDRILADVDDLDAAARTRMLDLRFELRKSLSAEEWVALQDRASSP